MIIVVLFPTVKEKAKIKHTGCQRNFIQRPPTFPTEAAVSFPRTQKTHEGLESGREQNFAPHQTRPTAELLVQGKDMTSP